MRTTLAAWLLLCLTTCGVGLSAETDVVLDHPVRKLKSGRDFRREIEKQFSASWRNVPLRSILRRISDDRNVSILLDRRIDPAQLISARIMNETVRTSVATVAKAAAADSRVVGSTFYVGPPAGCEKLRTLIEIRSRQLFAMESSRKSRQFEITRRRALHWNDLDEPSSLLREIAGRYSLELTGADRVPHDLWAGATLPSINAIESLSLILIQFDLTFDWADAAARVSIVDVPKTVAVEKSYSLRNRSAQQTLADWRQRFGGLDADIKGTRIVVRATVEKHEEIVAHLRPTTGRKQLKKPPQPISLEHQPFTFRAREATVRSIMKKFEEYGIQFKYDAKKLAAAGVDFEKRITIDVSKVKAEAIFRKLFEPLGLVFNIKELTVTLDVKK